VSLPVQRELSGNFADFFERKLAFFVTIVASLNMAILAMCLIALWVFKIDGNHGTSLDATARVSIYSLVFAMALTVFHMAFFVARRTKRGQTFKEANLEYASQYKTLDSWLGGAGSGL
jgi:ABC-type dipeptide/oligopeptide/nickel transport system permease subunit